MPELPRRAKVFRSEGKGSRIIVFVICRAIQIAMAARMAG
jgi:hypothetical protein